MAVLHMPQLQPTPTPEHFFELANAFQVTAALKAAVELDLFTAIAEGTDNASELAARLGSDARRVRILCDFLTVEGLLTKQDSRYGLAPDAEMFLVRTSPAYLGTMLRFLLDESHTRRFDQLTEIVRDGLQPDESDVVADNPRWVNFARNMAPLMRMPAEGIARYLRAEKGEPWKVLDIAAGHGTFGITIAKQNPRAEIVAVDWPAVLEVARENAAAAGVAERYRTLPGSAFDIDFGTGYDVVLLTNFLHHFDEATNVELLRKIHGALKPGGRAVALEFVPDESRVSPRIAAKFAIIMLAATPAGDSHPMSAFDRMFRNAGFAPPELVRLPGPESLVVGRR